MGKVTRVISAVTSLLLLLIQQGDSQPSELNFSSKEGQILTLNFTFPKKLSGTESMNLNLKKNQKKIAEINFKGGQGNKYNGKRLTFIWQGETQTATLSISGLIKNDSGVYQCNYVLNSKIEVSNSINLTVRTGSSYINQTDLSDPASTADSHPQDHSIPQNPVIAASVTVTALLLLVLSITVFLIWDRNKGTSSPQLDTIKRQQESKPSQAVPVYSIEYGVLEFPRRDTLPPATMPEHNDHVEYATITFPAGQEGVRGRHC
ncbi:programmed cell death protein 1-like isoform X2 [Huso huso]|uniref:Programmed cell death protein 1-like isoform X2 n=1 Tax=Huso huso TaxID=61971 RepID=A0ABR0ZG35_HUSHU